jgi:hypothetical protein
MLIKIIYIEYLLPASFSLRNGNKSAASGAPEEKRPQGTAFSSDQIGEISGLLNEASL